MLYIAIGFLLAHVALAAAMFTLGGEHPWVLALLLSWYGFAMLGLMAVIWVHYKKSTRRMESSH